VQRYKILGRNASFFAKKFYLQRKNVYFEAFEKPLFFSKSQAQVYAGEPFFALLFCCFGLIV
jgi:hypothetical protein